MESSRQPACQHDNAVCALAVFDRPAALQRIDGDEIFLATLVGLVLVEVASLLALLRQSLEQGDAVAVVKHAHGIKGSASAVGAMALAQVAVQIEQEARAGRLAAIANAVDDLEAALALFAATARSV